MMPTGYTAGVQDGTITTFKQYATECMRAFGATILLRDEPSGVEIPVFEPSDYNKNHRDKAIAELARVDQLTSSECDEEARTEYAKQLDSNSKEKSRKADTRKRYMAMLDKASRFIAPTPEHQEFSSFLVSQLTDSLDWDCSDSHLKEPQLLTGDAWKRKTIERLMKDVDYHTKAYDDEVVRTRKRNEWIAAAKAAIEAVEITETTVSGMRPSSQPHGQYR